MTSTAPRSDSLRLSPLDLVLTRLRDCAGFPTLSTTISDINRAVTSDSHSAQQLTQVILRDVSLTTKLLQLVNSAVYGQYHGRIRTVSKAVLILGFEAVRTAAMSLMMLEFSRGRPQEKALQDELIGAFFAGVLAKPLAQRLGIWNAEEAVICSMFQSLGRLLVTFFLYEDSRKIRKLVDDGTPEDQAVEQVLGLSYNDLGQGVAKHWNYPERLIEGMSRLKGPVAAAASDGDRLKIAANLANELFVVALRTSEMEKPAALAALSRRYNAAIQLDPKELLATVEQGLKELSERATTLNLPVSQSPAMNVIRVWTGGTAEVEDEEQQTGDPLLADANALDDIDDRNASGTSAQQVLSAGIRDVTETLTSDFALNDVLQMVLETMYRGMGFTRTIIFIRDAKANAMRARFGFGAEVERVIPKCTFPVAFAPDVFHVALDKGVDIAIENTQAPNIVGRIPEWHRQAMRPTSFLLLPIMLKNRAIGLLYADSERAEPLKIEAEQLGLLRTLRSQVVLAFKQSMAGS